MSDIHNVPYPPREQDTCVSHRRYDGKERLIARSVRHGHHFLVFRVNAFRDAYAWAGRDVDADTELQFNRARWHDPTVGRWLTRAPLGCDVSDGNLAPYPDRAAESH